MDRIKAAWRIGRLLPALLITALASGAAWADRDFRCSLLQLELFHQLGQATPWANALGRTEKLAGEREIPAELRQPPAA